MKIGILGLGYVGTVAGGCLAGMGHQVTGVDTNPVKIELFARGKPSFFEPGLDELLVKGHQAGLLEASDDTAAVVADCGVVIISVGTPSGAHGRPDLEALKTVGAQIGGGLARRAVADPCCVVLRSTIPPGTCEDVLMPLIAETTGREHGRGWTLIVSPEFMREGAAVHDFLHPPQTIIGARTREDARLYVEALQELTANAHYCSIRIAELVKYACNAFHAVKVVFANEMSAIAHSLGVDGRELMELLCGDTVLNISDAYLRPGNAFGGSCLPKDLRALSRLAVEERIAVPLLNAVLPANEVQIERLIDAVKGAGCRRVGIIGLAFKDDTDDLRESPMLTVVRELLLAGLNLRIYDPRIEPSHLLGRNLQFARFGIPDLHSLLARDLESLMSETEMLVLARRVPLTVSRIPEHLKLLVDLVGMPELATLPRYRTVFW